MYNFEILPHTSDFRLKINGNNIEELFLGAIAGMNSVIKTGDLSEKKEVSVNIEIYSEDASMLLIDFLSEVLSISHIKKAIFSEILFNSLTNKELNANVKGFEVDGFDEDIKAVSYSETEIRRNDTGQFEAIVVFDI